MYFYVKNILKNNFYHNFKHKLNKKSLFLLVKNKIYIKKIILMKNNSILNTF